MDAELEIVTPPRANQSRQLDFGLVALTEAIAQIDPDCVGAGFLGGEFGYGANYENDVFAMRTYYWGDCDCGYDQREEAWSKENPHAEDCYYPAYYAMRERLDQRKMDWDERSAEDERIRRDLCRQHGIPWNNGRGSAVHCTCGHDAKWAAWSKENTHAPTCSLELPNFRHKRTGFEVRWYKWIGRDMETTGSANVSQIMRACIESLPRVP